MYRQNEDVAEPRERSPEAASETTPADMTVGQPGRRPGGGPRRSVSRRVNTNRLARALGYFSLGLGLAQLIAPEKVARLAGVHGSPTKLIRAAGLRELGHAAAIFAQRRPAGGVWSRVAGDALDLTTLGVAFASPRNDRGRLAAATAAVAGITALDLLCARQLSVQTGAMTESGSLRVQKSITINRSPEELYQFWRNFENLPRFMYHLQSVQVTDAGRSRWVTRGPAGKRVTWEAEVIADRPNELIAWRSLPGAEVPNAGQVRFERLPAGRGTLVEVELVYRPPAGVFGASVAKVFGEEPMQQVKNDLRRFKQVMETGEVVRSEGSLLGAGVKRQRPAQPLPSRRPR